MTDANHLNFDKPKSKSELRAEKAEAEGREVQKARPLEERLPSPRQPDLDPDENISGRVTNRDKACVNLKLAGANFQDIAEELGYATARQAQAAYHRALANMNPVSSWETLRVEAAARAERQFARSMKMADADFVRVPETDDEPERMVPNLDKLRWHEQAGKDLALLVNITGAKAPARLEVSASSAELNDMVQVLLQQQGHNAEIEADVFDIGDVEDAEEVEE